MWRLACSFIFVFYFKTTFAQATLDSIYTEFLLPVEIKSIQSKQDQIKLEPLQSGFLYAGKKCELIQIQNKNIGLAEKYGRQIFSKVAGVFVYDMDGTGNQINISTRGLDPHRGWEFNIRKDGIMTNSDIYGYPASHYSIPLEAVERVEFVRGTGSLQYGAQFGGMLNYISKDPDTLKKIAYESINSIGSYGLFSTHQSISGKIKKFRYSAWINKKWLSGYRENSSSQFNAQDLSLYFDASQSLKFKLDLAHSSYLTQLPGPLTDEMFYEDPRKATRLRNYYNPNIYVPSIKMNWNITPTTQFILNTSAVLGSRNSVLFDQPATVPDSIVKITLAQNQRQVDIDRFNSYTSELKLVQNYSMFNQHHTLIVGLQYINNLLHRRQQGKGTTGADFNLSLVTPGWGRDMILKSQNVASFVENNWRVNTRFVINAGLRMEMGSSTMTGTIINYPTEDVPNIIKHHFPLVGINTEYNLNSSIDFYTGWSQAYRPVIFKDIIPASIYEVSDKNLQDAKGYNAEMGFRGTWKELKWDITAFQLLYKNRLGTLVEQDAFGTQRIRKTNIGHSLSRGIECFVQKDFIVNSKFMFSVYNATAWIKAAYKDARIRIGSNNIDISGNAVESTPPCISRTGLNVKYGILTGGFLYSYTSASYADALNTIKPNISGSVGLVPAYGIVDFNGSIRLTEQVKATASVNNILNKQYFTKRPQFYPGPGIWPSDGRTCSISIYVQI